MQSKKQQKNCRWKSVNCPYVYDYNQTVFGEARALSLLQHPNIVSYYFSWVQSNQLYLQLEYCCGGSLEGFVKGKSPMSTPRLLRICQHVCGALDYLGKQGLVHCDIKPSNVLMQRHSYNNTDITNNKNEEIIYKLSDFGTLQKQREVDLLVDDVEVGSGAYLPSILSSITPSVDIFSLGITLFELACEGRIPKNKLKSVNHKEQLGGGEGGGPSSSSPFSFSGSSGSSSMSFSSSFPSSSPPARPEHFQNLILDMINPEREKRPTAEEILERTKGE
mmetsp:Transcript_22884/g.35601  ORF Transcript_22884/g.35601 Transcript_22884/m.35601 type:complete len:277 (-) Transcript_22884:105-935(-)